MSRALLQQALQHYQSGRRADAQAHYRQVLAQEPHNPVALNMLGVLAHEAGQDDIAADLIRQAVAIVPTFAEAYGNLGLVLMRQGKLHDAARCFERVIELQPNLPAAHHNLGNCLSAMGQYDAAIDSFQKTLMLAPNIPQTHNSLGVALQSKKQFEEAATCFQRALALQTNYAHAHNNLGVVLSKMGRLDEAIGCYQRALASDAHYTEAHSNWIYALHFHPDFDAPMLLHEHHLWNQRHAESLGGSIQPCDNDRDPDRRLKIGYVSPDFRVHAVGLALLPLLEQHDHEQFEIHCFSDVRNPDTVTTTTQGCVDRWHSIVGITDSQLAELVRRERIDILVDLTLHMRGSRLLTFARKPAPVQVTYLGYPSTTGLTTMDYRLTDPYLDPPGSDSAYVEQTVRLPETYLCWRWRGDEEPVGPLPAEERGYITFGSLNNFAKVTKAALELWGEILSRVPLSHLMLRCPDGQAARMVREILGRYGVSDDRIELVGQLPWKEYVGLYQRQDIGLDPFPYCGHTTSCDSLWMGVPIITLTGATAVSRGGVSILTNIALPELIAHDPKQYVSLAVELAGDLPRLTRLRTELRDRMRKSPLMDAPRLARNIESAYRQMWRTWCESHAKS